MDSEIWDLRKRVSDLEDLNAELKRDLESAESARLVRFREVFFENGEGYWVADLMGTDSDSSGAGNSPCSALSDLIESGGFGGTR